MTNVHMFSVILQCNVIREKFYIEREMLTSKGEVSIFYVKY